jgi:hypothetical protein
MDEVVLMRDRDWSPIEGRACRVLDFTAFAQVEDGGRVTSMSKSFPYAVIDLECVGLPEGAKGTVTHQLDFLHLWKAFEERGVGDDEEVIVVWAKSSLKRYARFLAMTMPRLVVWICPKHAFELMTDQSFRPELTGQARFEAQRPVAEWKPPVMD